VSVQEIHLQKYLEAVNKGNKSVLPGILNPHPLTSQDPPNYSITGRPSEAWPIVAYSVKLFMRIPGARDRIAAYIWPNINALSAPPTYDYYIGPMPYKPENIIRPEFMNFRL
jgi:hypothetical protein